MQYGKFGRYVQILEHEFRHTVYRHIYCSFSTAALLERSPGNKLIVLFFRGEGNIAGMGTRGTRAGIQELR
jgi:hypothetical protein